MIDPTWIRKGRALAIAISVAGAAVLLMLTAAPRPASVAALGTEWQCTNTAFVLTTCRHAEPVLASASSRPACTEYSQTGIGLAPVLRVEDGSWLKDM